jgi:hypothetical protein
VLEHANRAWITNLHHQEETLTESSTHWASPDDLARELNHQTWMDDWAQSMLEDRVIRIEELIAARWWRRLGLRRRLARELRACVAGYGDWMPRGFRVRRSEYCGEEFIVRVLGIEHDGRQDAA